MCKKKIIILVTISFVGLLLICFSIYAFKNPFLNITLNGKEEEIIEVNSEYQEQGAQAEILSINLNKNIEIKNKVDITKIGKYQINYRIKHLFTTKEVTRMIIIVDTTCPIITLKGNKEIKLYQNSKYKEPGYQVTDNYDKDLEAKVKITNNVNTSKLGSYEIKYEVEDSSGNKGSIIRKVNVVKKPNDVYSSGYNNTKMGPTYINGILIVNKTYALPKNYNKGVDSTASAALKKLQAGAKEAGYNIPLLSGYRSYSDQNILYNNYVARDGKKLADTYSARPGHSEHQTGLAFDIGKIDNNYGNTSAGKWLAQHAHEYGFIIRYPKGKEKITGYIYEPWHVRYLGIDIATDIYNKGLTLEEYLNIA